jgi:hypothetical protein
MPVAGAAWRRRSVDGCVDGAALVVTVVAERIVVKQAGHKASLFNGIQAILVREGRLDTIAQSAPPALRCLLAQPPLASEWISGAIMNEFLSAIAANYGLDTVQRVTRGAVNESMVPLMRSYAGALLRLFGATPHSIFSRVNDVMKLTSRGVDASYRRGGERRLFASFSHSAASALHPAMFASWRGAMEAILDFCDVRGTVSEPVVNSARNGAEFEIEWR